MRVHRLSLWFCRRLYFLPLIIICKSAAIIAIWKRVYELERESQIGEIYGLILKEWERVWDMEIRFGISSDFWEARAWVQYCKKKNMTKWKRRRIWPRRWRIWSKKKKQPTIKKIKNNPQIQTQTHGSFNLSTETAWVCCFSVNLLLDFVVSLWVCCL